MATQKILISGITNEASRNILFQSAVYWAEEGYKVLYLTRSKFESVPSTGHGAPIPSSEVLAKIKIVYLESMEQLLWVVIDILTFRDTAPRVMLVDGLNEYSHDPRDSERSLARACATLCHVTTCCAAHLDLPVYLLVTITLATDKLPPVVCSMFDCSWSFDGESTLTKQLPLDSSPTKQLTLALRSDGAFVLRQVSRLFSRN